MADVRTAHTAYLQPSELAAARGLLDEVFAGEMTDADWEHALGGIHALAWEDAELDPALRDGADIVVDGGLLPGTPSTVVDLRDYEAGGSWAVLREGAVA
ncbi:MAG: aminoglycoside 2-N-acetyltransferase, partial [Solirubrobacteraceae bacterium]|nr:aminoglycoside 2-N-acetyltransferase [Solirubrobacteraceae bacterium]